MLTTKMIQYLLEELAWETVVERDTHSSFPFRIQRKACGYSESVERGTIQAGLSIMLEVAIKREGIQQIITKL